MTNLFRANSRVSRLLLQRSGEPVAIYRDKGNVSENKYGKISDTDKQQVHIVDEIAFRSYENSDTEPGYGEVTGGRVGVDSPRVAMFADTDAEVGDEVEFPDNKRYSLDQVYDRKTHTIFRATLITNG